MKKYRLLKDWVSPFMHVKAGTILEQVRDCGVFKWPVFEIGESALYEVDMLKYPDWFEEVKPETITERGDFVWELGSIKWKASPTGRLVVHVSSTSQSVSVCE